MTEQADILNCLGRDFVFSIDTQGRVAIPAEWRENGRQNVFMLIPGKEATLQLYPVAVFSERIMPKLKALSAANPDDLRKLRTLGSNIYKCECDKQGRIQLPAKLIEFAHLGKRAALIGSGDFGQIMSAERWEAEQKNQEMSGDSFLDILG